jgi:hypothetical protein
MSRVRLSRRRTVDAGPAPGLTPDRVWGAISKVSFAVLNYVTPAGEPRSSGVVCGTAGRRLYVATAPDSWKARHISDGDQVAVTLPIRRGGLLSLVAPSRLPPSPATPRRSRPGSLQRFHDLAGGFGVPYRFRTPDPLGSEPEWRIVNAGATQEVYP